MAETKKKPAEPEYKIREVYDAKATAALDKLILYAQRDGETKVQRLALTRKQETATQESTFTFDVAELTPLIALLTRFRDTTLPKLQSYGVEREED